MSFPIVDGVALVRLQSGKGNAMTRELLEDLSGRFVAVERSGARAVVLTGDGRFFSAGLALPTLLDLDRAGMKQFIELFNATMMRVFNCPLPVVAAVNGHAIAGGCVLALQCDYRLLVEADCKIGLNEVQLGIGLPSVVIETLRMQVPSRAVVPIAMEGLLFSPGEALELGLVEELSPGAELERRAHDRAVRLGAVPSAGFRQVKEAYRRPIREGVERNAAVETERWLDSWFSAEARARLTETVRRLAEKR